MFHVGQKVQCVDDSPPRARGCRGGWVKRGHVYHVSGHSVDPIDRLPLITVGEFPVDCEMLARRFRPLQERKTDISIFTAMLKDHKVSA